MHILFLHDAFPAQFGRLGLELKRRYGWRCSFLVQNFSSCPTPTPEMLNELEIHQLPTSPEQRSDDGVPWPQVFGTYLEQCQTVYDAIKARPELLPDLVVGHGGRGAPTIFLRDVIACPIINYCEYYFATSHRDISYRVDLPPAEPAPFFPRCINAPTLTALVDCDAGYSPTRWQQASFPARFRSKIEVLFDGIDTELYHPGPATRRIGRLTIPEGTKVVTFVSRGLESIRGFDLFMQVADQIGRSRSDVVFIVVGGEEIHYGWDKLHTGMASFKQWVLSRGQYDLSRFVFLGRVLPEQLAEILRLSDLHLYLSAPFVVSWSLFNAMACGVPVLASDVPPVREIVEHGTNGLLEPLFDIDRLTATALRVLADPAQFSPLGKAARTTIEERYSIERSIPPIHDFFERIAAGARNATQSISGSDARRSLKPFPSVARQ